MTQIQQEKFDKIYQESFAKMMRFANGLCRNRDEAHDVTQEAFVRAFSAFDKMKEVDRLDNWLMRIVYNTFIDSRRKKCRRIIESFECQWQADFLLEDLPDEADTAEKVLLDKSVDPKLMAAIRKLPNQSRDLVRFIYIEQKSREEVGKMYGVSPEVIRARLHRVHARLRKDLGASPSFG